MPPENEEQEQQGHVDTEIDEEEKMFAEMAAKREGGAGSGATDDGSDEQHTDDDEKAGGQAGAGGSDEEAAAAASAEASSTGDAAGAGSGQGEEAAAGDDEFYKGWPQSAIDAHKAALDENEKLQHRVKSDAGRVAAFQRQAQEAREKLGDAGPTEAEIAEAMKGGEKWEEFSKEYPSIAEALDERFGALENRVNDTIKPVVKKSTEIAQQEAYQEVDKDWPGWQQEVAKPEFSSWLNDQPAEVRAYAESDDPSDASTLMSYYDNFRVASGQTSMKNDLGNDVDKGGSSLDERRRQQMEDGTGTASAPAGVTSTGEGKDQEELIWEAEARKRERRQSGAA